MSDNEDNQAKVELGRLSAPKLAEVWTARPAQTQVLANVLYGRDVSKEQKRRITERMQGQPLSALASVVFEVLR
jgi:hypothetical protein